MILAISFQLYKYLLTNGQGRLKNVLRNAREGEGLKFWQPSAKENWTT